VTWLFLYTHMHRGIHGVSKLAGFCLSWVRRARREQWVARSGGCLVQGYGQLSARHGLKAIDSPRHPFA